MEIIPAIDIRAGRCVRLDQGDYERETVFSDDPAAMARRWAEAGARRLHVVDLDGAREGHPVNADVIHGVIAAVPVPVEVGGGIRDIATIQGYLGVGADRVVLGTAAVKDQTTLLNAIALFRERIVVGVDAREGVVMTEGWREGSDFWAAELVHQLSDCGVARIIYTDIAHDGLLAGPGFASIAEIVEVAAGLPSPLSVIAAGGISSVEHLQRLAAIGCEGAIVGKALYTGALDLRAALAAVP
ncbi:MAG: 1-(5-phosphoribosyl)-5-[(5-phosphoribosylamino)methylideneamino]imidazole-4-carboxamide isomerase [Dehalococcoidia bacterium]|nr:1-(5-phosphoribosyl)-5-[(5-phosphoribosylamino)methylideneamino]imidazole-4-carboxamide isomerase [Dehalococcoidia bacterium]